MDPNPSTFADSSPADPSLSDPSPEAEAGQVAAVSRALLVRAAAGPGRIVLAATPIGNTGDASARLIELLGTADIVAAEDTRRLHRLVQSLGVTVAGRVISYHEHNEATKTAELLEQVRCGQNPRYGH